MKKIIAILLSVTLLGGCVLTGCSSNDASSKKEDKPAAVADPMKDIKAEASTDKYRNYYEIFVNSFADSNEDDTGDLQGIISQLDYLNDGDPNTGDDLGIDGIWLTPIMPSKSYHKYDVEDYYDIDPEFGTLEDFDELVDECHKRGISIILDLVLNHISSSNPMFEQAAAEVADGNLDGNAKYFEIHKSSYFDSDVQTISLGGGYECEANFSHEMPEWNLNSKETREEFTNIAKFWLEDHKVDGFRLDACKFYNNKDTDGAEFLKWFYETCQKFNPDVYMVGETWSDDSDIEHLYTSGIDSQFAFKFSTSTGTFISNVISQNGMATFKKAMNYDNKLKESNPNEINAMFLSNHDQVRSANVLEAQGLSSQKLAAAAYLLCPGNPFIYYGEEIGIKAPNTTNDAAYRSQMIFDSENLPSIFVNGIGDVPDEPTYGGVKQQLEDKNSLLNYYRRILKIKLQNPEIARGSITSLEDFGDSNIGAYYVEYDGSKLMIIHNFNKTDAKELTITDDMIKNAQVRADLVAESADKHIELKDGKLSLPAQSTVVLKSVA